MGREHLPGELQRRHRLLARHARKVLQELTNRVPCFKMIEQGTDRHTGPSENRRSAENVGVAVDQG